MKIFWYVCGILFCLMVSNAIAADDSYTVPAQNPKIAPVFQDYLMNSYDKSQRKIWVFFTDKEIFDKKAFDDKFELIDKWYSGDAMDRRRVRCENGFQPDILDIPVSEKYIDSVKTMGLDVRLSSRWLNAVSGYADQSTIERLIGLDFVAEIRPVAKYQRSGDIEDAGLYDKDVPNPGTLQDSDYGPSLKQADMINARLMHKIGFDGRQQKVAIMDGGFRYDLPIFADTKIIDEYDFVHDDASVMSGITDEEKHGTAVLSVIGGFMSEELIGLAYNAEFMLYETEDYAGEYPGEEDFWVAAAERADAGGADIITTSVGYLDWYTYSDLNGMTAPITVAADIAFNKGIFVVASAGNERGNGCDHYIPNVCFYYIVPPADGFNVLAVGAVDSFGVNTDFSSAGPTYDGRIKPDVVALGKSVHCVWNFGSSWGFYDLEGTSFSAPLVAGGVALILDANKTLTVSEIRNNLLISGDRRYDPDNLYGYGLPDVVKASGLVKIAPIPDIAAPVGQYTLIPLDVSPLSSVDTPKVENMPDSAFLRFVAQEIPNYWEIVYYGFPEDVGTYDARVIIEGTVGGTPQADTASFIFRVVERAEIAFGPNPFTDSLSIFISPSAGQIEDISIFAVSGDKVWNSFSDNYNELTRTVVWDGTNSRGREVAPGVYLVIVRTHWANEKFKVFKK